MTEQGQRRSLQFGSLDEAAADARSLLEKGYTSAGKWNLSQVCQHLADWMRFPMDGFPRSPLPVRILLRLMRHTIGKSQLRKILKNRGFAAGGPTMPDTVYELGTASDADAVRQLEETIERFKSYDGPLHPSPVFGAMDRQTLTELQLAHTAHHLSFLIPKT